MSRVVRAGELAETVRFETMPREGCIGEWRRTIGDQSLKYVSVQFMRSALAYEAQIKANGGHASVVRKALKAALKTSQRASETGGQPKLALRSSLRPGTHLVREWNGRTYQVEVLEDGFRMDGKRYRSLSAIAKKITDAHWSGPRFFGLG
ncbi:DUF2924 domain-containing protein [Pseudohoeflea coraliihabitans]|uniref:DUF2924 domain-containing protein n=1 Tax=Pseudohoeflea coraliihabitans TaxID=2860393 RepID=A0ABS6WPZ2_9HYPH|nr:DUF2924 domain-containing protein [Pseudohoeflea sp. DP4N28-3]MBW3097140.1 DUF2924 domain-containing protein [Pseudohoeflea sp. DP4N28-3]